MDVSTWQQNMSANLEDKVSEAYWCECVSKVSLTNALLHTGICRYVNFNIGSFFLWILKWDWRSHISEDIYKMNVSIWISFCLFSSLNKIDEDSNINLWYKYTTLNINLQFNELGFGIFFGQVNENADEELVALDKLPELLLSYSSTFELFWLLKQFKQFQILFWNWDRFFPSTERDTSISSSIVTTGIDYWIQELKISLESFQVNMILGHILQWDKSSFSAPGALS